MAQQWDDWGSPDDDFGQPYKQFEAMNTPATPAPQTTPSQQSPATDPFAAMAQPWSPNGGDYAQQSDNGISGFDAAWQQPSSPQQPPAAASQPAQASTPSSGASSASSTLDKYRTQLQQLGQSTDPREQAVLKDQIGRSVFSELKTAGHDVAWDGDTLVIDGRSYVIGDGTSPIPNVGQQAGASAAAQPTLQQGAMTYGATGLQQAGGGTPFAGFNDERALSGGDAGSAKDAFRRVVGSLGLNLAGLSKQQVGEVLASQVVPQLLANGIPAQVGNGQDTILVFTNERGWEEVDVVGNAGSDTPQWVWGDLAGGWGAAPSTGGGGAGIGSLGSSQAGTAGASGVQTQSTIPTPTAPTVDGIQDFTPTGPTYQPGTIGTEDIPGRDYASILGDMGQYTPNAITPSYQFDGFRELGATTQPGTEALINQLLANPESLDARTVDMLKARSREEQAQMAASLDDDLTGLGYDLGIDSSAWLGSEKLAAKRSRDEAIIRGNRDIDMQAAETNMADRRAAAQLGASYTDATRGRNLAEAQAGEGNKQAASAQDLQAQLANEQNVFNAAQLQSNNAVNAARVQIDQAAALTDRLGLRESVAQAAAELGISRDKLMADFALAKANELTQRYGIDVGQFVDLTKLKTAHGEFIEDLLFRMKALEAEMGLGYAQLGEQGRQFDVGAGIDLARLQQQADEFGVNAYYRSLGL